MEKALIVNLICSMLENVAMIAGIVYSAVYFERFALLWFLLLPALNSVNLQFPGRNKEDSEGKE